MRIAIRMRKKFGGFEYDRFPINKDSRDNGSGGPSVCMEADGRDCLSIKDNEDSPPQP